MTGGKNQIIISVGVGKSLDKIQQRFMMALSDGNIEISQLDKGASTVNIMLDEEGECFPLRIGTRPRSLLSLVLFSTVLDILVSAILRKEI